MIFKKWLEKFIERKLLKTNMREYVSLRYKDKDMTFTLWWWIAKNIQDRSLFQHACYTIAKFYKDRTDALARVGITEIVAVNNTIFIYLENPSLFIGRNGETINKITDMLNTNILGQKVSNYEIKLKEDNVSWKREVAHYLHWTNMSENTYKV